MRLLASCWSRGDCQMSNQEWGILELSPNLTLPTTSHDSRQKSLVIGHWSLVIGQKPDSRPPIPAPRFPSPDSPKPQRIHRTKTGGNISGEES